MIEHFALRFARVYHNFCAQMELLLRLSRENSGKALNERVLTDGTKYFIADLALQGMIVELDHLEFPIELRNKMKQLYCRLLDKKTDRTWTAESLLDALTDLNGDISRELEKPKYNHL